ncbi:hypothetical protein P5673_013064 [Acropora cervicornis]|uniref:Uncharacterized protein n=1 Tax=Acropora cervicornis TaxID=6130 RepID=A0AAD9V706_ACRCE|nr:hypothetical protein P5673_013064 [Acropora cervicornis]
MYDPSETFLAMAANQTVVRICASEKNKNISHELEILSVTVFFANEKSSSSIISVSVLSCYKFVIILLRLTVSIIT